MNPNHVKLNFIINHEAAIDLNEESLKDEFLKPLLEYNFTVNKLDDTEVLYLSSINLQSHRFCIPAQGINCLRYDENLPLNQSNYTSTARAIDEVSFFESWEGGETLDNVISALKSVDNKQKLPPVIAILNQQKTNFLDSLIICAKCSELEVKKHEPFIFKSASDLRKFVNEQLEKRTSSIGEEGINNSVRIFIYKDLSELREPTVKADRDRDGIPDVIDECDSVPGKKICSGCPCLTKNCPEGDKDGDGICDNDDNCPADYGQKKYNGCPPDSDGDGLWDKFDICPNLPGKKGARGCPDKDMDKVPDKDDQCPDEKGSISNNGCPDLKIQKLTSTSNVISFSSENYIFKETENIQILFYHKKKIITKRKLVPSEIRAKQFSVSGQSLSEQIGSTGDKLYVELEFLLDGKPIGKSEIITFYCNQ